MAIYGAGYEQTKAAADVMASEVMNGRRRVAPAVAGSAVQLPIQDSPDSPDSSTTGGAMPSAAQSVEVAAISAPTSKVSVAAGDSERSPVKATSKSSSNGVSADSSKAPSQALSEVSAKTATASATKTSSTDSSPTSAKSSKADPDVKSVAALKSVAAKKVEETDSATAADAAAAAPVSYRDGMYLGRGTSRHGDIEALVEINNGRIVSAVISQCLTRYSCSWISALPPQVVARQSPDVDYVSGATQSANAFYYAVLQALSQAK